MEIENSKEREREIIVLFIELSIATMMNGCLCRNGGMTMAVKTVFLGKNLLTVMFFC